MIHFEQEICATLSIPSIPKKEWDKKSSFKTGVAITELAQGEEAYAVCTFDAEVDESPRVIQCFAQEPFYSVSRIFVVPSYMDVDTSNADLDEESKKAAERLAKEAEELAKEGEPDELAEMSNLPEWIFPEINSKEEAVAWLRSYNSRNRIKGKVPSNEETIKLRLMNIYSQINNKDKK